MHRSLLAFVSLAAALAAQDPVTQTTPAGLLKVPATPITEPDVKATPPGFDPAAGRKPAGPAAIEGAPKKLARTAGRRAAAADPYAAPIVRTGADGALHATTADYKVRFDADGFQFCARPAPGAHGYDPVRFDLQSVRVGTTELGTALRQHHQDGNTILCERASCVERLELRRGSTEHSFVFTELPRTGALRLTLATTTALVGEDRGDGVAFTGEHTTLHYGEAVAIDADGRAIHAPTTFAGGTITIDVPADFVATARLPLVVDPVLGAQAIFAAGLRYAEPDAAWDQSLGVWAVCYEYEFSPFDRDVFVQRYDADLNAVGTAVAIDATTDDWRYPRIANNNIANQFLVVAQASATPVSPFWIAGGLVSATGSPQGVFDIEKAGVTGHATGDKVFPDVGGDAEAVGPTFYTVVWQRVWSASDHDVHMKQVTTLGTLRTAAPVLIDNSGYKDVRPAISNSCGAPPFNFQRYGIAWQREVTASDNDVRGAFTSWDGNLLPVPGGTQFPIATGTNNQMTPSVSTGTLGASADRRWLFAWGDTTTGNGDIGLALTDSFGAMVATANLSQLNGAASPVGYPQWAPAVETDGARFAVTFLEGYQGSPLDPDSQVSLVAPVNGALVVQDDPQFVTGSQYVCQEPRAASQFANSGVHTNRHLIVDSDVEPAREVVWLRNYDSHQPGWALRPRAAGCGALTMFASGSSILGESFTMSLSQTSGLVGVLVGGYTPAAAVPVCPGCTVIVVDPVFWFGPTLFVAVPLNPALVGAELGCQGIGYGTGPCLGGFELSNGFQVTVR